MVKFHKADGTLVDFDVNRIIQTIMAAQEAANSSNFDEALQVAMTVQGRYLHQYEVSKVEINTYCEDLLMDVSPGVARKYIEQRVLRDLEV